ncbi:MAG: FprA family A-type flavoprotein [Deltaproteobacteria bacterium]|nr:MAG: FprA family A-type flavoprotein [Deltaproteobacteria bacterium]
MPVMLLKKEIYSVRTIDWDRRLFDELIPLPDGTSYNAYLIKGKEKIALIDTVDPTKEDELVKNLKELEIKRLDYIVSQHAEQDHSGALPRMLSLYPEAKVVTNNKCKEFLMKLLLIPEERFMVINEGDSLSLGDKTLNFVSTPWVHWPETMISYLKEDKILFTCDFFGSHYATSALFADEAEIYKPAKRYYAEIMMPFRKIIKKHLERIKDFKIEMIAPSHGPIYTHPQFIIDAYKEWVSDKVKNEVVIPYISMHGSTEKMVYFLINALIKRDIKVIPFNLTKTDVGELAMSLVDAATLIVASPTMLTGPHPAAVYAVYLANLLRPKLKFVSVIGSYGWGSRMLEQIKGMLNNLKVEVLTPVIIRGHPKEENFRALENLANEVLAKHREIEII